MERLSTGILKIFVAALVKYGWLHVYLVVVLL